MCGKSFKLRDPYTRVLALRIKFTFLGATTGWQERMTFTVTTLIATNGEKSKPKICLLRPETDISPLFTIARYLSLEGMMALIE